MALPEPFAYPMTLHVDRHAPAGYQNYQEYKPWLRDEFEFRCVYCLQREMWSRERHANFSVDHVVPQSEAPQLECVYQNLVYACLRCNSFKRAVQVLDPRQEGLGRHLRVEGNGSIVGLTDEGEFLIKLLRLNEGAAPKERRRVFRILARLRKYPDDPDVQDDFLETFAYPEDLPDLRGKEPPNGNALVANTEQCFFAREERDDLPDTY
jgi:hypothetical protein